MTLLGILLAALITVAVYLITRWVLAKLNIAVDDDILKVGAIILFILLLLGKINLGI